jgi:hypothetical protein
MPTLIPPERVKEITDKIGAGMAGKDFDLDAFSYPRKTSTWQVFGFGVLFGWSTAIIVYLMV